MIRNHALVVKEVLNAWLTGLVTRTEFKWRTTKQQEKLTHTVNSIEVCSVENPTQGSIREDALRSSSNIIPTCVKTLNKTANRHVAHLLFWSTRCQRPDLIDKDCIMVRTTTFDIKVNSWDPISLTPSWSTRSVLPIQNRASERTCRRGTAQEHIPDCLGKCCGLCIWCEANSAGGST